MHARRINLRGGRPGNGGEGRDVVTAAVQAMGEINTVVEADRRHHHDDRRDRVPDQSAGAQCGCRSGARGRTGPRLCGSRLGGAQPGAAQRDVGQRDQGLIQDSVRKVENGSELVEPLRPDAQEIVASVKRVSDIVAEIAAASQEQAGGIEQVGKAMLQMDQVTQENAAQTEELSSTAQALATHAQQMQSMVSRFRSTQTIDGRLPCENGACCEDGAHCRAAKNGQVAGQPVAKRGAESRSRNGNGRQVRRILSGAGCARSNSTGWRNSDNCARV